MITNYAVNLEPQALAQFKSAMAQDYAIKGALMPDAHTGYSLPIGGVVATQGVIVPSWVGYDIGCGMCALPTTFLKQDIIDNAPFIFNQVYHDIPTGFATNKHPVMGTGLDPDDLSKIGLVQFFDHGGLKSIGTLGGGNHFIEIGYDQHNIIWIIIHSGSRGVGWNIAQEYMRLAGGGERAMEGHFPLKEDSELGLSYINDLKWCLEFALQNRKEMMKLIGLVISGYAYGQLQWTDLINRNHNHADYDPKNSWWVHRKGATHAEKGMSGVIPGNMRDGSFIVVGKGCEDSLCSSSHGAGRAMSRTRAYNMLALDTFEEQMVDVFARVCDDTLDEAPDAYKDIHGVMALQTDLVEVTHRVLPLINIKGVGRSRRRKKNNG